MARTMSQIIKKTDDTIVIDKKDIEKYKEIEF